MCIFYLATAVNLLNRHSKYLKYHQIVLKRFHVIVFAIFNLVPRTLFFSQQSVYSMREKQDCILLLFVRFFFMTEIDYCAASKTFKPSFFFFFFYSVSEVAMFSPDEYFLIKLDT